MATGGTFNGINVGTGLGRYKFEKLAYFVMRFLSSQATFATARSLYISTATTWAGDAKYGFNSDDVCVVRDAWAAVEVGFADADCDGIEDNIDDSDKDGVTDDTDNCMGIQNPAQEDFDGDGDDLGDACDLCPDVADWGGAYTAGGYNPPKPYQFDSDHDGFGDACDDQNFGSISVREGDLPFNPTNPLRPTLVERIVEVAGTGEFALPLPGCEGDGDVLSPKSRFEVTVAGLDDDSGLHLWIADEMGNRVAKLSETKKNGLRGMRFQPDCQHRYTLGGLVTGVSVAPLSFGVRARIAPAGRYNPWTRSEGGGELVAPTPDPDRDDDGIRDVSDNCPATFNPRQTDSDHNGTGDACQGDCGSCALAVEVDVKPHDERNEVRLRSRGQLAVAILSASSFDATSLDQRSILVAGAPLVEGRAGLPAKEDDVNGDGRDDLVVRVSIPLRDLFADDTRVTLVGRTKEGQEVYGSDGVTVIP